MPHFRVDDALDGHPKSQRAGDEALGMWVRAGSWCMRYLTDGFVPDWWVKQQPKGTAKARRLVEAGLWHAGAIRDGEKGWQFHEFTAPGRQDSRAQVEADRDKWRKKKAGQRAAAGDSRGESPPMSPGDKGAMSPGDSRGESPGESLRVTRDPTQPNRDIPGYVQAATHDPTASEPRSAPVGDGWPLVREIIPDEHPQAVRTELAIQASALLKAGSAPGDVAAALRLWPTKNLGPKALPSLVSEVINTRNRPAGGATAARQPPSKRKVNQALDLAAQFAQTPPNTPALESR